MLESVHIKTTKMTDNENTGNAQSENQGRIFGDVIQLKIKSEDSEERLRAEMKRFMESEPMVSLGKAAEDSRLEYETRKDRLMDFMESKGIVEMKSPEGHSARIISIGKNKKIKVTPKR